ncbi:hypothetical protein DVH24_008270 [Malus domestica]|uniref:pyridoxal 5'-phosphate synthase (glutamine hydrolyzing) n=1 Tax=Malus domestica TaxID=3750 RepID=A0A498JJP0_MALDO|nr:hypothetical protein DVH24_008270 [Malus domestica]
MSNPKLIKEINLSVTIPVMAKACIGHFVNDQILEAIGVDYVDENEILTLPFVYSCWSAPETSSRPFDLYDT